MRENILLYDRFGFIPSPDARTLDDYLREAEQRKGLLEQLERYPARFLAEHFGEVIGEPVVIKPPQDSADEFLQRFDTKAWVGLHIDSNLFERIYLRERGFRPAQDVFGFAAPIKRLNFWFLFIERYDKDVIKSIP